jgi:hypothetical protein
MPTITIKRDEDRNYDRLFRRVRQASAAGAIFGGANSVGERQTDDGYEVTLPNIPTELYQWLRERQQDFAVRA